MQRPDQEKYNELVRVTRLMRERQNAYFKSRTSADLSASKQSEKAVDTLLLQFPDPAQPMTGSQIGLSFT